MNEWLAVHGLSAYLYSIVYYWVLTYVIAVDFFNHLNMLYGTVTEFCTPQEVRGGPLRVLPPIYVRFMLCLVSDHVSWPSVSEQLPSSPISLC